MTPWDAEAGRSVTRLWLAYVNCQWGASMTASISQAKGTVITLGAGGTSKWFHLRTFSVFFFFFLGSSDLVVLMAPRFISAPSSTWREAGRFLKRARQTEAQRATISTSPVHAAKRIIHGGMSSGFSPKSTPSSERTSSRPLDNSSLRRLVMSLTCWEAASCHCSICTVCHRDRLVTLCLPLLAVLACGASYK